MRVVHIATTSSGGAYKATERISKSLECLGVESEIIVRTNTTHDSSVEIVNSVHKKFVSKTKNFINLVLSNKEIVSDWLGENLSRNEVVKRSDIIVLHWCNSFVSFDTLFKLGKLNKPIVWVLHDMWPLTGGCHHSHGCNAFKNDNEKHLCKNCVLADNFFYQIISSWNARLKRLVNNRVEILYVALCDWELGEATKSGVIKGQKVVKISNPIDGDVYKRIGISNEILRDELGIAKDKKVVLFGADTISGNKSKGIDLLLSSLEYLDSSYAFYCFGNVSIGDQISFSERGIQCVGYMNEQQLVKWYNAADVVAIPSVEETFCYVCVEAMACGTRVVAFETWAFQEHIIHKTNGYLAEAFDVKDFAKGIIWCASYGKRPVKQAYEGVLLDRYGLDVIGQQYNEIFTELLNGTIS